MEIKLVQEIKPHSAGTIVTASLSAPAPLKVSDKQFLKHSR